MYNHVAGFLPSCSSQTSFFFIILKIKFEELARLQLQGFVSQKSHLEMPAAVMA